MSRLVGDLCLGPPAVATTVHVEVQWRLLVRGATVKVPGRVSQRLCLTLTSTSLESRIKRKAACHQLTEMHLQERFII